MREGGGGYFEIESALKVNTTYILMYVFIPYSSLGSRAG